MNSSNLPKYTIEPESADRAIRMGFFAVSLFFSYFSIRLSMSISRFHVLFSDMLGGKPLPHLTQFVLETKYVWICMSIICALAPIGFAFMSRKTAIAIYGISASTILQILQLILLWTALTSPLTAIFMGMTGSE